MAILASNALTMLDWAKRVDDDGKIAMIVEILSQTNEILLDMLTLEGNGITGHKTTVRTGLPSGNLASVELRYCASQVGYGADRGYAGEPRGGKSARY